MDNNEYRKHYYLDEYTIVAPNRKNRSIVTKEKTTKILKKADCVFCDNHEPKVYTWPNANDWQIKAVKNIHPSVDFEYSKAYGYQEVIIEFPDHVSKLSDVGSGPILNILKTYQKRIKYIIGFNNIEYLNIFKNVGRLAGATQEHLHSQIWAMPIHPPVILQEIANVNDYIANNSSCPVCDLIIDETEHDIRLLEHAEKSILLSPYSARFAYEAWIVPTNHFAGFVDIDLKTLKDMAQQLYNYACFLDEMNVDYGIVVHDLYDPSGHVYIKIMPRLPNQIQASIEFESGIFVNPVSPESVKTEYHNSH